MLDREEMDEFQFEMQHKLDVHSEKERKFRTKPIGWLIDRLKEEYHELEDAWLDFMENPTPETRDAIRKECADVANFAAFIHVNAKDNKV